MRKKMRQVSNGFSKASFSFFSDFRFYFLNITKRSKMFIIDSY